MTDEQSKNVDAPTSQAIVEPQIVGGPTSELIVEHQIVDVPTLQAKIQVASCGYSTGEAAH